MSGACDEYIQNVSLNTINNTTACTAGGYISYASTSTSLAKGSQYTATITPAVGATIGQAYTNDEIAVWIDYNNDFTFSATERVGYVIVAAGWSNQFTFTVPASAITGAVKMRVRISYSVDGAIDPCAVSTYGEVEDYTINITAGGGVGLEESTLDNVMVYPNPANEIVTVDLSSIQEKLTDIQLVDITGRVLRSERILENVNVYNMSLAGLAQGTYTVVCKGNNVTSTTRLIKN